MILKYSATRISKYLYRAKVEKGWLIFRCNIPNLDKIGVSFITDPEHSWAVAAGERECIVCINSNDWNELRVGFPKNQQDNLVKGSVTAEYPSLPEEPLATSAEAWGEDISPEKESDHAIDAVRYATETVQSKIKIEVCTVEEAIETHEKICQFLMPACDEKLCLMYSESEKSHCNIYSSDCGMIVMCPSRLNIRKLREGGENANTKSDS